MRIVVHLSETEIRHWHLQLVERLATLPGATVAVWLSSQGTSAFPAGTEALFQLEAVLYGLNGLGAAQRAGTGDLARFPSSTGEDADLLIDISGNAPSRPGRRLSLTYNSEPGETALLAAIMDKRTVIAALVENGRIVASGRTGTEYPGIVLASYQDMVSRTITLITATLANGGPGKLPVLPDETVMTGEAAHGARVATLAAKALARNIVRRIYWLCYRSPHWRTGWRRIKGGDLFDLRAHPAGGWTDLPDDGKRFYADPFPIVKDGKVTLFVEDFIHSLGKGIISAVPFGPDGPQGKPEPVLEEDCHLSYPFVFEREGEMWMIPETNQRGTIELFRATAFPKGWVGEAVLVSGVSASDATIVEHAGRWWMFATVRDGGGAFSDALHLWSAPDFKGPWTAHPKNPVLVDIASARPAGRMVVRAGQLLRPVQDCRKGYGNALGIARVTRLDEDGFDQVVETILTAGPQWPGTRLHTVNSAGGFEFIDGSARAPRWT